MRDLTRVQAKAEKDCQRVTNMHAWRPRLDIHLSSIVQAHSRQIHVQLSLVYHSCILRRPITCCVLLKILMAV
jgi:hypothetical protein